MASPAMSALMRGHGINVPKNDPTTLNTSLKSSVVATNGLLGTFTRTGTSTVVDHNGIIRTIKENEVGFEGARRVENLIPDSTNNPYTTLSNVQGGQPDPNGGNTAFKFLITPPVAGSSDVFVFDYFGSLSVLGSKTTQSAYLKVVNTTSANVRFLQDTGATDFFSVSDQWDEYSAPYTLPSSIVFAGLGVSISVGDAPYEVHFWHPQLEFGGVSSEYISTGDTSLPATFHGAGVDGVKYFETLNGNAVDANNVLSRNTGALIPDATLKGAIIEDGTVNHVVNSEKLDIQASGTIYPIYGSTHSLVETLPNITGEEVSWLVREAATQNFFGVGIKGVNTGLLPSTTYTKSFFLKLHPTGRRYFTIANSNYSLSNFIDLRAKGVVDSAQSPSPLPNFTIEYLGGTENVDALFRISFTEITNVIGSITGWNINPSNSALEYGGDSTNGYAGDPNAILLVTGIQIESGSHKTSYIKTGSATVGRGTGILSLVVPSFMQTTFSVFTIAISCTYKFDLKLSNSNKNWLIHFDAGTNDKLGVYATPNGAFEVLLKVGGTNFIITTAINKSLGKYKIALSLNNGTLKFWLNGALVGSAVVFSDPVFNPSVLGFIGSLTTTAGFSDTPIRDIKIYKKALSDAKCLELTT